jgi:polysaccharide export outer membrane protein
MKKIGQILFLIVGLMFLNSCKMYTSNIILKTEKETLNWKQTYQKVIVEYPISIGDKIQFSVFTNSGENIIEPSGKMVKVETSSNSTSSSTESTGGISYEVLENGTCHFPLIGRINVVGLKVSQIDSMLAQKYETYYNEVYIVSKVINRKVIVINGVAGQLIPFRPNMSLFEVIALGGGLSNTAKAYNIRIVRGDLNNPEIKVVNLSSVKSMKETIVNIMPYDIIYVEPVRKTVTESVSDNIIFLNISQLVFTFYIIFNNNNR